MGGLSWIHWLLVIVVVLLLFGRGKLSELMGDFARGIKSFKQGLKDDDQVAGDAKTLPPQDAATANSTAGLKKDEVKG